MLVIHLLNQKETHLHLQYLKTILIYKHLDNNIKINVFYQNNIIQNAKRIKTSYFILEMNKSVLINKMLIITL